MGLNGTGVPGMAGRRDCEPGLETPPMTSVDGADGQGIRRGAAQDPRLRGIRRASRHRPVEDVAPPCSIGNAARGYAHKTTRHARRLSRKPAALLPIVMVIAVAASPAAPAKGGEYIMRTCDVPKFAVAPIGPWHPMESLPNLGVVDGCTTGSGLAFTFSGAREIPANAGLAYALVRPKTVPQASIRFVKRGCGTRPG